MISVDYFNPEKHYETVAAWWKASDWPVVPLSHLSQTGLVVSNNGAPAAAAWIYKTDSAFCILEFIVADPAVRREARTNVISVLVSAAKMLCRSMGFQSIYMSIKNDSLAKRIEAHGFKPTDKGMTSYLCEFAPTGGG
jgi:hypothetical protein